MLTSGAVLLPLAAVVFVAGPASAGSNATGTIQCTKITGTVSFTPPLTNTGTAAETATTVKLKISKCAADPKASAVPKKGTVSSNIATPTSTDSCGSLLGTSTPTSDTVTAKWSPTSINSSVGSYSGFTISTGPPPKDDEILNLPGTGGTSSTAGSYAGSGQTSTLTLGESQSSLAATCSTPAGLKSIKIISGDVQE